MGSESPPADYRSLANALPQIIWTCDVHGKLEWVNDRWTELTGLSLEDSLHKGALVAVHPDDQAELGRRWTEAFATTSTCEIEYRIRTRAGEYRWHVARVAPVFGSDRVVVRWVAAVFDVHDLKQAEARLLETDRRKDEFLALLSHELRNPLSPIITAAQIMELRGDVAAPEEREVILRQARYLVRLVDDLLDVSRVARGKITLSRSPVELGRIVTSSVETTGPLIEKQRHRLSVSVPASGLVIDGDELRLTQVVNNLLTNAARYTPPGGHIELAAVRDGNEIVLRVRDNGRGIDPGLLPTVFEMFIQAPRGPDRAEGGLGLGLALVRSFTELHGGTVSAASDGPDRGSEFTVRLPALTQTTASSAGPAGREPIAISALRLRRVLVVDDNVDAALMIARLLESTGHRVEVAHEPVGALAAATQFRPEVAIIDLGLPVMDGYTLARELRKQLRDEAPILIALTGYGAAQDMQRSREAGFRFHLVKPVAAERLVQVLDSAFS